MNALYDAFKASMRSSAWKAETQKFEHDWLHEITQLKKELKERTYKTSPGSEFVIHERGKVRYIHGGKMRDRVVRHALCDEILTPALGPYLIHNNGASQKGKGVRFAREQFERDLHNYYLEHRTNEGYVAFVDFSKFYDNIPHEKTMALIAPHIDSDSTWLLQEILDNFKIDVSYMDDAQYSRCMGEKFDSVAYHAAIAKGLRTGRKYMRKSVEIGDQASQNIGVFYPTRIDNYVTNVRGHRRYVRYMDDMAIIHHDHGYLEQTIEGVRREAEQLGIFINEKKTRICRLSDTFKYLQVKYFLSDTGRVVKRINPASVTRERRKLKAYRRLLDKGGIEYTQIEQAHRSWMGAFTKLMSKKQIRNMKGLYFNLFRKETRWKK